MFSRSLTAAVGFLAAALFSVSANAQSAAPTGAPAWMTMVPIFFAFIVMMVFSNWRQSKTRKERDAFLTQLQRGEEVVTSGGLLGRIEGMTDLYLTLEIAPGTRIKVLRSAIAGLAKNVAPASSEVKA